jgi:O-antigen/teichoic acid export membrane protein
MIKKFGKSIVIDAKNMINDRFIRNAVWLYLSPALLGGLGFVFWLIATHLVTASVIGESVFVINVSLIIALFSLLGLDSVIIRNLNNQSQKTKGELIGASLIITIFVSFILCIMFTFIYKLSSIVMIISVIALSVAMTLNTIFDSVFTAVLVPRVSTIMDLSFALLKLCLIFSIIIIGRTASNIVYSWVIAFILSLIVIFVYGRKLNIFPIVIRRSGFIFLFKEKVFALSNYVIHTMQHVSQLLLPIIVIAVIGNANGGYVYMSWNLSCQLLFISDALAMSLFAEGSTDAQTVKSNIVKIRKCLFVVIIPITIIAAFLGKYVLYLFGNDYYNSGKYLFTLFAIANIPYFVISVYKSIGRVGKNMRENSLIWAILIIFTFSVGCIAMNVFGTIGIAYSWLVANTLLAIYVIFRMRNNGMKLIYI